MQIRLLAPGKTSAPLIQSYRDLAMANGELDLLEEQYAKQASFVTFALRGHGGMGHS